MAKKAKSLSWTASGTASHGLQVEGVIFSALGRPQLECWVQSWAPQCKRHRHAVVKEDRVRLF